ncbi:MAG: efflux RND transporter periplasmic adaptor subunit [Vicinamibacterales bacterium]
MKYSNGGMAALAVITALAAACGSGAKSEASSSAPEPLQITVAAAAQQSVNHVLRVTGTLTAAEEAEVAAETAGRVIGTPVERGSRVAEGSPLITLSQVEAQSAVSEAEASAAQLEARLAIEAGEAFSIDAVPEVASAKATRDLAEAEFARIRSLLDQKVVSQAEFDQRRTQVEATSNQYRAARNAAQQQFRMLEGAKARLALARKALGDTVVRAPFTGLVMERQVSVGDFVTRGTKVATVVKIAPLRVELTVPEQSAGLIAPGQTVRLVVDAFPGRYFEGDVRFVSPAFRPDQRALTVEAIVPNPDDVLKPGMFAAAEVMLPSATPSIVVPSSAVATVAGVSHVFVVRGTSVEQRMITTGLSLGPVTEVLQGLSAGEMVATSRVEALSDGAEIRVGPAAAQAPAARK